MSKNPLFRVRKGERGRYDVVGTGGLQPAQCALTHEQLASVIIDYLKNDEQSISNADPLDVLHAAIKTVLMQLYAIGRGSDALWLLRREQIQITGSIEIVERWFNAFGGLHSSPQHTERNVTLAHAADEIEFYMAGQFEWPKVHHLITQRQEVTVR